MEKELIEKKNDLITRAEEVLNKAKIEKRELTDAEAQELAEIRDNVRRIVKTLGIKEDFDKMEDRKPDDTKTEVEIEKEVQETRAFENYIRGVVTNERATNLNVGDNGAVIPETILNKIIKKYWQSCLNIKPYWNSLFMSNF